MRKREPKRVGKLFNNLGFSGVIRIDRKFCQKIRQKNVKKYRKREHLPWLSSRISGAIVEVYCNHDEAIWSHQKCS